MNITMQSKNNKSKTSSASTQNQVVQSSNSTTPVVAVDNANSIVESKLRNKVVEVKKTKVSQVVPVETVVPVVEEVAETHEVQPVVLKKRKNTKTTPTVAETTPEVPVVVETTPVVAETAPVVAETTPVVVEETAVVASKGRRVKKVVETTPVVAETAPVVAETAPVVVAETAVVASKGRRVKKVVETTPVVPEVQVAGTKNRRSKKVAETAPVAVEPVVETTAEPKKRTRRVAKVAVAEPEVQETTGVQEVAVENSGNTLRYFKLFYNNENKGRYCGRKPKQAANKAFSSIVKDLTDKKENLEINFSIKECTRNSKHKEYRYVGKREVLPEPVPVYIPHMGVVAPENIRTETPVSNVTIRHQGVETVHSGKEFITTTGAVYLASSTGQVYKKIIYHYHNKIQKAPKLVEAEEVVVQ